MEGRRADRRWRGVYASRGQADVGTRLTRKCATHQHPEPHVRILVGQARTNVSGRDPLDASPKLACLPECDPQGQGDEQ